MQHSLYIHYLSQKSIEVALGHCTDIAREHDVVLELTG
jgi:hypothetical protein